MAKVVASVWVAYFVQFLAALAVLPQSVWKKRLNSSYSSKFNPNSGVKKAKTTYYILH